MLTERQLWNPRLLGLTAEAVEPEHRKVPKTESGIRARMTFKAYKRLDLLNQEADKKAIIMHFYEVYEGWNERNGGGLGDVCVMPPMTEDGLVCLYKAFGHISWYLVDLKLSFLYEYKIEDYNLPKPGTVLSMVVGGETNENRERGLYFTECNVKRQRINSKKLKKRFGKEHKSLKIADMDPVSYILVDAIRMELGQELLDSGDSFTTFVAMPPALFLGDWSMPHAAWNRRSEELSFSFTNHIEASWCCGVRFVIS